MIEYHIKDSAEDTIRRIGKELGLTNEELLAEMLIFYEMGYEAQKAGGGLYLRKNELEEALFISLGSSKRALEKHAEKFKLTLIK